MGEAKRKHGIAYREAEKQLQGIARGLTATLPNGVLFALVVFEPGESKYAGYVSNAMREDMIMALRECAHNLEAGHDVGPGEPIPGVDTEAN